MAAMDDMPDLSHLTEEERKIIQEVLERQKVEEKKEHQVQVQYEKELDEVDRQINDRKEIAAKQVGTQDDAICQICQKTKFADGIGHKCYYCQLRSCARCGGRTQIKLKTVWACALCQKKQQILAKTGKWFHKDGARPTTPTSLSPTTTPTPPLQTPGSFRGSVSQEFRSCSQNQQQLPLPGQQQGASSYGSQGPFDNEINLDSRRSSDASRLNMSQQGPPRIMDDNSPMPSSHQNVPNHNQRNVRRPENVAPESSQSNRRQQSLLKQPSLERRASATDEYSVSYDPRTTNSPARNFPEMSPSSARGQANLDRRPSADRRQSIIPDRRDAEQRYPQGPNGHATDEYNRYNGNLDRPPVDFERRRSGDGDIGARERDFQTRTPDDRMSRPTDFEDTRYRDYERDRDTAKNGYTVPSPEPRMQQRKPPSPQRAGGSSAIGQTIPASPGDRTRGDRPGSFREDRNLRPGDSTRPPRDYEPDTRRTYDDMAEMDHDRRQRSISYSYPQNPPQQFSDERDRNRSFRRPASHDRDFEKREKPPKHNQQLRDSDYRKSPSDMQEQYYRDKEGYARDAEDRLARKPKNVSPREERRRLPFVSEVQEFPDGVDPVSRLPMERFGTDRRTDEEFDSPSGSLGLGPYDRRPSPPEQNRRFRTEGQRPLDRVPRHRKEKVKSFHKFSNYLDYTTTSAQSLSSSEEEAAETASTSAFVSSYDPSKQGFIRSVLCNQRSRSSGDVRSSKLVDMLTMGHSGPPPSSFGITKQLPVMWQISVDGARLIGRMVFKRQAGVSLGLKVIGGRPIPSGHLSAFVTRVKKGSVADYVGQLRPGDEVLEWNGRCLQDSSFDEVCQIINDSKYDDQIDIIISRPTASCEPGFGDTNVATASAFTSGSQIQVLDPSTNLISRLDAINLSTANNALPLAMGAPIQTGSQAPLVMITAPADLQALAALHSARQSRTPSAQGQIFGSIEIALLYSPADEQLVVTVYQAMDLPPRADGCARNPYVKLFLLPDRSEKSRRQSNILANTCRPVWQQSFIYQKVLQLDLTIKVLEVTLWDYDQFVTNDFLGEVLFDLSMSLLDNDPRWYTLTDMNEESPIRVKLRQLRPSAYSSQGYPTLAEYGSYLHDPVRSQSSLATNLGYQSDHYITSTMPRSRTYNNRYGANGDDLDNRSYTRGSGYVSDHGFAPRRTRGRSLDPSLIDYYSADMGIDPQQLFGTGAAGRNASTGTDPYSRRHLPRVPLDLYGEEALRELDDKVQQLRSQGYVARRHRSAQGRPMATGGSTGRDRHQHRRASHRNDQQQTYPNNDQENAAGYLSDGSETSMSITSTQSEHPRTRTAQEFQRGAEMTVEEQESYDAQEGTMSDSAMANSANSMKSAAFSADAKRKKSLMTRLMPGRGNAANASQDKKRLGFPRSQEVGVPVCRSRAPLLDQANNDSSIGSTTSEESSWMPKINNEGCLGEFVPGLAPGQVVGRQVLASPCMGEIQLRLLDKGGNIEVTVVRAKQLAKKPSAKYNAAPYVKVYLMDGKHCIAKAKTAIAPRTADPKFDQLMVFTEPYKGKFLQISVWGDYGRMERRIFMGIALIKLDKLDLSKLVEGWYKLYHANSLVGTASPARKDSENSAAETSTVTSISVA